jgi:hypothetical protein
MSDLTPRKQKLYNSIRSNESAHCKLRKKYRARKMKYLCDMDSDPLMQDFSNSLNAEAVRLLAAVIRNSKHKPQGRRWNFKDNFAQSLLQCSPKSYILLRTLFPLPSGQTLHSVLGTVQLMTGINSYVFDMLCHYAENV